MSPLPLKINDPVISESPSLLPVALKVFVNKFPKSRVKNCPDSVFITATFVNDPVSTDEDAYKCPLVVIGPLAVICPDWLPKAPDTNKFPEI